MTAHLRLSPGESRLIDMRHELARFAAAVGADDSWLLLAATELAANAMQASPAGSVVDVDVRVAPGRELELVVTDEGPGPPVLPSTWPPAGAPRGRGLLLVQELSASFWFERVDGRTTARCRHPVVPAVPLGGSPPPG